MGEEDTVQRPVVRSVRGVFRAGRLLRAGRVQWLPDDEQSSPVDPRDIVLAAFRAQPLGAVRGKASDVAGASVAFLFLCRHGWELHSGGPGARRGLCRVRVGGAARGCGQADDPSLRRRSKRGDRALSIQPQWLDAWYRWADDGGGAV